MKRFVERMDGESALDPTDVDVLQVALIGYGEVGTIFGAAIAKAGVGAVKAFDVQCRDAHWLAAARERAGRDGVTLTETPSAATVNADLVISAVTAAATHTAARRIAEGCRPGAFVVDVNSASPGTKQHCADAIDRAGGRYVEAAVMSSVPPHGIRVPMLLGGPHGSAVEATLARLGFVANVASPS